MIARRVGLVLLVMAAGGARAEGPLYTAGRVLVTADGAEQGWIDYLVEGQGAAALERCQRLVRDALRENVAGPHVARSIGRDCDLAPLPTRAPEAEARILRRETPLPVVDLFAIGLPGTRGRVLSSQLTPSETACLEMREVQLGEARPRRWVDESARRAADEACADAAQVERRVGGGGMWKKIPRTKKLQLRLARERCARARDRDKFESKHEAADAELPRCVRE